MAHRQHVLTPGLRERWYLFIVSLDSAVERVKANLCNAVAALSDNLISTYIHMQRKVERKKDMIKNQNLDSGRQPNDGRSCLKRWSCQF